MENLGAEKGVELAISLKTDMMSDMNVGMQNRRLDGSCVSKMRKK